MGNHLGTRTHFKDTERNVYISTRSCHHLNRVKAFPKGPFLRIKQNCKKEEDYRTPTNMLIGRFLEKGYNKQPRETPREQVGLLDPNTLLIPKNSEPPGDQINCAFLAGFNVPYREVQKNTLKKILQINLNSFTGGPQGCATCWLKM